MKQIICFNGVGLNSLALVHAPNEGFFLMDKAHRMFGDRGVNMKVSPREALEWIKRNGGKITFPLTRDNDGFKPIKIKINGKTLRITKRFWYLDDTILMRSHEKIAGVAKALA